MIEKLEFIFSPDHAESFAADCRAQGKQVVLAHGVFDVLHLGHVRHLNRAKEEGDVLIVSITDDEFVNKGPDRPFFTARVRAEMLASLDIVDGVVINHAPSAIPMLDLIKPDVYVKGSDYANPADDVTGKITAEKKAVEAHGGRIAFTDDVVFSSSNLINRQFSDLYSDELQMFLRDRRNSAFRDRLLGHIEAASKLKVLVIGDAIMDEYIYVHALGKASKENIICTRLMEKELFAGGVFATANHVASFCDEVTVLTCLGAERKDLDTINASLKPNVKLKYIERPGAPTTRKTRYIDKSYLRKLFEIYDFEDKPLPPKLQNQFDTLVEDTIDGYDLVVVNDFGHGLLAQSAIDLVQKKAKFLAANAQSNSANQGFNMITKYGHADFVCIDGPEARMAIRDKHGAIDEVLRTLSSQIACSKIITTHGEEGCLAFDGQGDIQSIPAFTKSVVDTVGAGDAFLSIASTMACIGAPLDECAFLGNAAGALKVGIVGHSQSVEKPALISYITALLK